MKNLVNSVQNLRSLKASSNMFDKCEYGIWRHFKIIRICNLEAMRNMEDGLKNIVDNGNSIKFLVENWCCLVPLKHK